MTSAVTPADTVRWLHDSGLYRLAAFAGEAREPIAAYAVATADGTIAAYPALAGPVSTTLAGGLPPEAATPGRLVVVGLVGDAVLVVDLGAVVAIAIHADDPMPVLRSWAAQLLLNPEVTLTTNSAAADAIATPRYRQMFIPGGGPTIFTVDDGHPPVTTVTLNPPADSVDRLDLTTGDCGELRLGSRSWSLRHVMTIEEAAWSALAASMSEPSVNSAAEPEEETV
jgi:hypothetical protein